MESLSKADQRHIPAFFLNEPHRFFPSYTGAAFSESHNNIVAVLQNLKTRDVFSEEHGWQLDQVHGNVEEKWAEIFNQVLYSASLQTEAWYYAHQYFAWRSHEAAMMDGYRKPDVLLVPKTYEDISTVPFGAILTFMEIKETFNDSSISSAALQVNQCAGYAMACQINRLYYISSVLENKNRRLFLILHAHDVTYYSNLIMIDKDPILFIQTLIALSSGHSPQLGFDRAFRFSPKGSFTLRLDKTAITISKRHYLRSLSVIGRGTKVVLCKDEEGHSLALKDAWLIAGGSNDVDSCRILKERAPEPFASEPLEALFGERDELNVFRDHLSTRGTEWNSQEQLPGIPVVIHAQFTGHTTQELRDRLVKEEEKRTLDSVPPRNQLRTLSPTCGVPIYWFSCRREFLNSIMCAVIGHFNGLRKGLLHSDVTEANIWLCVDDPQSADDVIRDPSKFQMHQAVLGDWGMAEDRRSPSTSNHAAGHTITGSFPFTSGELLSSVGIQGGIRHEVVHDLESFFWIIWVVSVNTTGPFRQLREWVDQPDESTGTRDPEDAPGQDLGVPIWATPGIHSASTADIFQFKKSIPEPQFISGMSTYWRAGESGKVFRKGMSQLRKHFAWTEGSDGEYHPPRSITHQEFIRIVGSMRDGILVEEDQPTEIDVANARERYNDILRSVEGTTILEPLAPSLPPERPPHTPTTRYSPTLARISGSGSKWKGKEDEEDEDEDEDSDLDSSDEDIDRDNAAASGDVDNDSGTTMLGASTPSLPPERPPHTPTTRYSPTLAKIFGSGSKWKGKEDEEDEDEGEDSDLDSSDEDIDRDNAAASSDVDNDSGTTMLGASTPSPPPGRPPTSNSSTMASQLPRQKRQRQ